MKLFKIPTPGAKPGEYEFGADHPPQIVLGEGGRGRSEAVIAVTGDGPDWRAKKVDGRVILVRGVFESEARCLAIINTVGGYSRSRLYNLHNASGVEMLATGHHAFGDAGRVNSGPELLAVVSLGAEFRLKSKYAEHWYFYRDGEWGMETPEEREARIALQKFRSGEGEWL